ncbi:pilus assembly protein [Rhodoblastus acidophilus]|uniref:TadE/TadG family type IV pilus assembly protein n=1 Tax=Candidatus Rhodoblastus alkanivorans TaxID=2954117 RepID=UPI001FA97C20|nr:TadE/TadG family type IV pilus assembly protein [Candidatus Rhodoblastus alkanivorans]MCI4680116.1 pilus assembly protein [Candidatus Rhodoblastus alkanivorans]MDI4640304.1 pilus assembly protein [Rhodoblastus acidophilus]
MKFLPRLPTARPAEISCRSVCGFARANSGASAVEFAFVLPIAVYLFIGVVDYGIGLYRKMEVNKAAQVGAEYAVIHGFTPNATLPNPSSPQAILNAVANASIFGVTANPAPSSFCGCASASGVVKATCGTTCSDGTAAGTYLTVRASGQYRTALPYPLVPSSFSLNGLATVRMQ